MKRERLSSERAALLISTQLRCAHLNPVEMRRERESAPPLQPTPSPLLSLLFSLSSSLSP
jgi:hypothetical protein